jgi:two-component system, NtrC family, nitrogen regulation sensor histidine kinase NtrY
MTLKHSWLIHLGWILLIIFTALFAGILYAGSKNISFLTGGGFLLLIETSMFIYYLNSGTRQIPTLFQSLENQDTSIRFTSRENKGAKRELADSLNHAIKVFHRSMLEYAAREQLLLAMIENAKTGFIAIDEHGNFELMNQKARSLLQCDHTSNLSRLEDEDFGLFKHLRELSPGGQQVCRISTDEKTRYINISSAELRYRDKAFSLVTLQDIQNEIEIKEMESWQKLMRILNHEIMNSIAPVISASKSLIPIFVKDKDPVTPLDLDHKKILQTISGLEVIENMSTGLRRFVHNYRRLSKIPEPNLGEVNPMEWTRTLKQLLPDSIPDADLSIDFQIDPNMGPFKIDDKMFNQVMLNLVKNAWEAPSGKSKKQIWVYFGHSDQNNSCIRVINNGEPIPADIRDQIFTPFFTTKEKGDGIGLFMSRLIVTAHKGSISVFTRPDEMTVFEIIL